MKAVILAGGLGSRLSEETSLRPKPMVEIGGKPILWHIMKIYSAFGINDFIVCLGYKGYLIKEYFANYHLHLSDVTIDTSKNTMEVHQNAAEPWRITLVDTGENTMTGGRLKRVSRYIQTESSFCFTYGDGLANIDLHALIDFHQKSGRIATVTAVQPTGRFGSIKLAGNTVCGFQEKPHGESGWVNGGFFVLSPAAVELIENDQTVWERQPLEQLAERGQLGAYFHDGFWQPMDTLRDKTQLQELWDSGAAPWRIWK